MEPSWLTWLLLGILYGLVPMFLYHRIAMCDQAEAHKADLAALERDVEELEQAVDFWRDNTLALERRLRETNGERPKAAIQPAALVAVQYDLGRALADLDLAARGGRELDD